MTMKASIGRVYRVLTSRRQLSNVVFDRELKNRQREFCLSHLQDGSYYDYLKEESARQLVDRLEDITRPFPVALEIGSYRNVIYDMIQSQPGLVGKGGIGGVEHLIRCDPSDLSALSLTPTHRSSQSQDSSLLVQSSFIQANEEDLPFQDNSFDLAVSNLHMHWVNDLPAALKEAYRVLKPDGAFLASFLGGKTLEELRHCFYLAEMERRGGVAPHCSPMLLASDVAGLIQGTGFALPTIDVDTVTISYPNAFTLMDHLWRMGEGLAGPNRQINVGRDTFLAVAALYQHLYGLEDGSVKATFEFIFAIGWKPDASQPKPCARGSAQHSLKELERPSAPSS